MAKKFSLKDSVSAFFERRTLAGKIARIIFVVLAFVWGILQYLRINRGLCFRRIYIYELLQYLMYLDIGVLIVISICKRLKSAMGKVIACVIAFFLAVFAMAGSVIIPMIQYMQYMYVPVAEIEAPNGDDLLVLRSLDIDTVYVRPDDLVETNAVRWSAVADNEACTIEGELLAYSGMDPTIKAEWLENGDFRLYPEEESEFVSGSVTVHFTGDETAEAPEGAVFFKSMTNTDKTHVIKLYRSADTIKIRKETLDSVNGSMLSDYGTRYQAFRMKNKLFFIWDYAKQETDGILLAPGAESALEFRSEWIEEGETLRVYCEDAVNETVVYYSDTVQETENAE